MGSSINPPKSMNKITTTNFKMMNKMMTKSQTNEGAQPSLDMKGVIDSSGKYLDQQSAYNKIINSNMGLQLGDEMVTG